jgi:tetratricopeptide (TPR) repeat protein
MRMHALTAITLSSILALSSACTRSASLTVLQPAQFKVPDHIAKIAVIDRSKPSNGWLNVLEGLFTGEAIGQDRRSREEAVRGLTDALQRTPRFRVISTGVELAGSKAGVNLPTPLPWAEIEKICGEYGADAVVAIESFDSDNNTSTRTRQSKKKNKDGSTTIRTDYLANMRTAVRMGWRFYDPTAKKIFDEVVTDDFLENQSSGSTERSAVSSLPSQISVTRKVAFTVGQEYGMRIAPVYVSIKRQYYTKAKGFSEQIAQANRFAQAGNWDRAAEIWKKIEATASDNPKSAGRAAYNMAVVAEVKGNLDLALEWAEKAWTQYGNKKARAYIDTIRQRQYDTKKVEEQLNKKV